jgi:hypothetical protein
MKKTLLLANLGLLELFISANAYANTDLGASAKKLGGIVDSFGIAIVAVFLSIAGLYVASGSQEGPRKLSLGLIGTIIFFLSGAIIASLKTLK